MEQFNVKGMSCAACQARVEKAVSKVDGVTECSVSLLTNSMGVEGTATPEAIIKAVEAAGYKASQKKEKSNKTSSNASAESELEDTQTPVLLKRLIVSVAFLLVLMYFSMGHMMLNLPLPSFFTGNHVAYGMVLMLLTIIIMVINQNFFITGFKGLFHGAPNMDSLIALGSSAAFIYSLALLFLMTAAVVNGDEEAINNYMQDFYFESAAMILTLITVGKTLESYSKGKTTNALKALMKLAPKTANVIRDGKEVKISAQELIKGDIFVVYPGESIPVDGRILEGSTAVDESALTGESLPVDKEEGSIVSSGTLNKSGFIKCEAVKVGEDTTIAKIIQMVSDAAATKAPVARLADKISGVFVPVVILIAVVVFVIWMLVTKDVGYSLARAISVLVVSCPCALGLATPVAIMVGNGVGARCGILFKTAESLQETGNIQIVALDKTGTITNGEPVVTDIIAGADTNKLLSYAYSLESKSEHPLAKAVLKYCEEKGVTKNDVSDFLVKAGNGLSGNVLGTKVYGGNKAYIEGIVNIEESILNKATELSNEGKTPLFFATDKEILGLIAVADTIKADSEKAIKELKNMGIYTVMLTGDNENTAAAIGRIAGVDKVVAGVLPDGKESVIKDLQKLGKVAMIGDGINDAPALTKADIGIAIGAGTDVAIDAADVVLMKSSLLDASAAVRLSRRTYVNIKENLFWAFFYNIILIPAAAGAYIHLLGITMNPMFGAAAMSLSSFCVVTNALRLNLIKIYDPSHDKETKKKIRGL